MKVYVKKDKVLKLLGEGKIFSKKDLLLRELNQQMASTVSIQAAKNVNDGAMQFKQAKAQNPTITQAMGAGDDMLTPATGTKDNQLVTNANSQESLNNTQSILNKMSPEERENTDVTYTDGSENMENSSVTPRKVMDEMRENSVPFTKSELTEFLKSI